MNAEQQKLHDALVKGFIERGKLIEAGFASLRVFVIAPDAPQDQVDEMRMAFMAGAQHLLGSIMNVLDPGEEPSEADMKRMSLIGDELEAYGEELKLRTTRTEGSA